MLHSTKRFGLRFAVVCLAAVALCGASWFISSTQNRAPAPTYEGKSLKGWARLLTAEPIEHRDVVVAIGAPLVPYLTVELKRFERYPHSVYQIASLAHSLLPSSLRREIARPTPQEERRINAVILLGHLGPQAKSAVPVLVQILRAETLCSNGGELTGSILTALAAMGVDAREAAPILLEFLEDDPQPFVMTTLVKIGAERDELVPLLKMHAESDGPLWLRKEAAWALVRLEERDGPARP